MYTRAIIVEDHPKENDGFVPADASNTLVDYVCYLIEVPPTYSKP